MLWIIIGIILFIIILWQYFCQEKMTHNTVLAFVGTMGSGKTFLAVREALRAYKKVKLKRIFGKIFLIYRLFEPNWNRKPVIYSNFPIRVRRFGSPDRRYCEVFKKEHILRRELLPDGAITVLDEIGQFASQWDYENPYVREQLADFTRFYRHWIDGRMIVTDQSSDNIVKVVRCRLGIIYHLNDFHRWLKVMPFFKVDVTPLLCIEDSKQETSIEVDSRSYFFGILHYKILSRLLNLNRYNTRCYSRIYREGASRSADPYDKSLKTRYLIDISVSKAMSKDYKDNRNRYREALYQPAPGYNSPLDDESDGANGGGAGEGEASPEPSVPQGGSAAFLS